VILELESLYATRKYARGFSAIAYWSRNVEGSNTRFPYGVFFGGVQMLYKVLLTSKLMVSAVKSNRELLIIKRELPDS
jgi:hypothetical protein